MAETPDIDRDLRKIEPLVGIMARERTTGNPSLYDDARQEGLIRVWQERLKNPDAPSSYLTVAARSGVRDVVRGRRPFGAESHRGRHEPLDSAVLIGDRTTNNPDANTEDFYDVPDEASRRSFEAVTQYPEVRLAVSKLPQADIEAIVLHFAQGLTMTEAAKIIGVNASTLRKRMKYNLLPAIQRQLEELEFEDPDRI